MSTPLDLPRLVHMPPDTYHADPAPSPSLSSSMARTLVDKSPAHAWARHPKLGGEPHTPTDAMDRGALIHRLVLGAGEDLAIVDAPDWRTKAAREARETARANGEIPVLVHLHEEALEAAARIREGIESFGFSLDGQSEVACIWQEETESGPIWCRSLFDHVHEDRGLILDLKSSRSAHPRACSRHILDYGYDIQRAAYVRGLERVRPELAGRVDFALLFVEVEPPYAVTPGRLDGLLREYGERRWTRACETWARCLRTNQWPGYAEAPVYFEAPGWLASQMLQEEM